MTLLVLILLAINDINSVSIIRDNKTKAATLILTDLGSNENWSIYAGSSSNSIDKRNPILSGTGNGNFTLNMPNPERKIFHFRSSFNLFVSERHLPMEKGYNFRDIGGYKTINGKYVKWGNFIRSDETQTLTDEDVKYLKSIGIKVVVDFRSEDEIKRAPDKIIESVSRFNLSISPKLLINVEDVNTEDDAKKLMKEMYLSLVSRPDDTVRYFKFFEIIQQSENAPLLYHCTAGKDRTGVATYLLLSALGVEEETIIEDFLLSNEYLKYKPTSMTGALDPVNWVYPEYINESIEYIKSNYGGVEQYLKDALKVNVDRMRELYTEDQDNEFEIPYDAGDNASDQKEDSSGTGPVVGIVIAAAAVVAVEILLYIFVLRFQNPNRPENENMIDQNDPSV